MSRWSDKENSDFSLPLDDIDREESRLLDKFYDYVNIEKNEVDRRRKSEKLENKKLGLWTNRFFFSAIIHVAIITGFTFSLIIIQLLAQTNLIEFLSKSFDTLQWLLVGYVLYLIVVVSLTITGIFYNHIETTKKQITSNMNNLSLIHFVGMSIAGPASSMSMIMAGLVGSGMITLTINENVDITQINIFDVFYLPIIISFVLFLASIFIGGIVFFNTFLNRVTIRDEHKLIDDAENEFAYKNFFEHEFNDSK